MAALPQISEKILSSSTYDQINKSQNKFKQNKSLVARTRHQSISSFKIKTEDKVEDRSSAYKPNALNKTKPNDDIHENNKYLPSVFA